MSPVGAGRAVLVASVGYPFGTFQARDAAMINLGEVVVHNWDLARSTGQELTIDPDLVAMVDGFCRSIPLDEFRAYGAFGPEVESTESTLRRTA